MLILQDNFFDLVFVDMIDAGIDHFKWEYGHKSDVNNPNHTKFFVTPLWDDTMEDNFFNMLWRIIQKKAPSLLGFHCWRVIANGQVKGQDGNWHIDHGDKTVLYFPLDWASEWGGSTYFKIDESEEEIEYKKNRLIIFDSTVFHYGSAPCVDNVLRVSIAFNLRYTKKLAVPDCYPIRVVR